MLRQRLQPLGLPTELFSGISLRSGAASSMAAAGVTQTDRMAHGRWLSPQVADRYVRAQPASTLRPTQHLAAALLTPSTMPPTALPWDLGKMGEDVSSRRRKWKAAVRSGPAAGGKGR